MKINALAPFAALALAMLAGCSEAPAATDISDPLPTAPPPVGDAIDQQPFAPDASPLAPGFAPLSFDLAGTGWLVTAVDGVPVSDLQDDVANIYFGRSQIRWRGCNAKEALYIPLSASFVLGRSSETDGGCAKNDVDTAMNAVIGARPLIGRNREGKVMLAAEGHTLTMSQVDSGPRDAAAPPLNRAPFVIMTPDAPDARPVLTLHPKKFAIWMDCGEAISGNLRLLEGRLRTGAVQVRECETYRSAARQSLADFFRADPYISRAADGEILLSDGTTVIAARQCEPGADACHRETSELHMPKAQEEMAPPPESPPPVTG